MRGVWRFWRFRSWRGRRRCRQPRPRLAPTRTAARSTATCCLPARTATRTPPSLRRSSPPGKSRPTTTTRSRSTPACSKPGRASAAATSTPTSRTRASASAPATWHVRTPRGQTWRSSGTRATGSPTSTATRARERCSAPGYVAAEDRLFFMDVLRHAGRAQLSSFAGGAPGNRAMDQEVWASTPYAEQELRQAVRTGGRGLRRRRPPAAGRRPQLRRRDQRLHHRGQAQPAQDAGRVRGHRPAARTRPVDGCRRDLHRLAGRGHLRPRRRLRDQLGARARGRARGVRQEEGDRGLGGLQVVRGSRAPISPCIPTRAGSITRTRATPTSRAARCRTGARSLPPRGRGFQRRRIHGRHGIAHVTDPALNLPRHCAVCWRCPSPSSNALLVSAKESESGRPIAVFGPQVSYFSPEILMETDVHAPKTSSGPAISARGASFIGTNLFVQLGRGDGYSWSATSAGQDITDTFAVRLCDPDGGKPQLGSLFYEYGGQCLAMDVLERENSWAPTLADSTAAGSEDAARPADAARDRGGPRQGRRAPGGLHEAAQHLLPRGRLGDRVLGVQRSRTRSTARVTSSARRTRSTTRSTGSTSTTRTSPTSTPGTTRCGPRAPTPTSRSRPSAAVAGLQPGTT